MKRTAPAMAAWLSLCLAATAAQPASSSKPATAVPPAPSTPSPSATPKPFDPVLARLHEILDKAAAGGNFTAAAAEVSALWDWTCINVPADQPEVFREVAGAQRLMDYLTKYTGDKAAMIGFFRTCPRIAGALAFQISPGEGEEPLAVLATLDVLRAKFPAKRLEEFPNLTAAICVVYDKPVVKQVNENQGKGVSAVEAFQFYTQFESSLVYSPRTMPVELLIYMIDPGAQLNELAWAMDHYGGQREVGPRYSEIHYDNDHFKRGKEKKITSEGFNLFNIKKYGGICADQAHFASTVGKAIGVPAVVDSGASSDVGHAWLGYLKMQGKRVSWNFDAGRYDEYEDVRGSVTDPQTGASIPDGTLALSAEAMYAPDSARQASTAMVDAAQRLRRPGAVSVTGLEVGAKTMQRSAKVEDRLGLLQAGLTLYSANHRAWNALRAMASAKELSLEQKKLWTESLQRYCGDMYPDFTLAVLTPMVSTIDDMGQQGAIWDALYKRYRAPRPDLASQVMIEEGRMWDRANQPDKAYDCYTVAAYQFINKSPASVDALERCETLLQARHAAAEVLNIYANAWKRLSKPSNMAQEFLMQSNWYRVGSRYAELLDASGDSNKAEQVRRSLGEDEKSVARRDKQLERQNRKK